MMASYNVTKYNETLSARLKVVRLSKWMIAKELGMTAPAFSVKLRSEISPDDEFALAVDRAIKKLSADR